MNLVTPPGEEHTGLERPAEEHASSLEYKKCSLSPGMWCSWLSTACEL